MKILFVNSYDYDFTDQSGKQVSGTGYQACVKNYGKLYVYKLPSKDQADKCAELIDEELSNFYIDKTKNTLLIT